MGSLQSIEEGGQEGQDNSMIPTCRSRRYKTPQDYHVSYDEEEADSDSESERLQQIMDKVAPKMQISADSMVDMTRKSEGEGIELSLQSEAQEEGEPGEAPHTPASEPNVAGHDPSGGIQEEGESPWEAPEGESPIMSQIPGEATQLEERREGEGEGERHEFEEGEEEEGKGKAGSSSSDLNRTSSSDNEGDIEGKQEMNEKPSADQQEGEGTSPRRTSSDDNSEANNEGRQKMNEKPSADQQENVGNSPRNRTVDENDEAKDEGKQKANEEPSVDEQKTEEIPSRIESVPDAPESPPILAVADLDQDEMEQMVDQRSRTRAQTVAYKSLAPTTKILSPREPSEDAKRNLVWMEKTPLSPEMEARFRELKLSTKVEDATEPLAVRLDQFFFLLNENPSTSWRYILENFLLFPLVDPSSQLKKGILGVENWVHYLTDAMKLVSEQAKQDALPTGAKVDPFAAARRKRFDERVPGESNSELSPAAGGGVEEERLQAEKDRLFRILLAIATKILLHAFLTCTEQDNNNNFYNMMEKVLVTMQEDMRWNVHTIEFARQMLIVFLAMVSDHVEKIKHDFAHPAWYNLFDVCALLEEFIFHRPVYTPPLMRAKTSRIKKGASLFETDDEINWTGKTGMHIEGNECKDAPIVEKLITVLSRLGVHNVQADLYGGKAAQQAQEMSERMAHEKVYWQRIHVLFQTIGMMDRPAAAEPALQAIFDAWKDLKRPARTKMIELRTLTEALQVMVVTVFKAKSKSGVALGLSQSAIGPERRVRQRGSIFRRMKADRSFTSVDMLPGRPSSRSLHINTGLRSNTSSPTMSAESMSPSHQSPSSSASPPDYKNMRTQSTPFNRRRMFGLSSHILNPSSPSTGSYSPKNNGHPSPHTRSAGSGRRSFGGHFHNSGSLSPGLSPKTPPNGGLARPYSEDVLS
eukprot:g1577.t1